MIMFLLLPLSSGMAAAMYVVEFLLLTAVIVRASIVIKRTRRADAYYGAPVDADDSESILPMFAEEERGEKKVHNTSTFIVAPHCK